MTLKNLVPAMMAILAFSLPVAASAQTEASVLGAKLGYTSKNESMTVGAFYQCMLNQSLRLAPELGFTLRNQSLDAFSADINVHMPLSLGSSNCNIYPIAGLDFTSWGIHGLHSEEHGKVSKSVSKFGINLGAGFEYFTKRNLKIRAEWKYTITTKYSTTVADFGVGYMF